MKKKKKHTTNISYSQSYPQYPQKYTMFVVFVAGVSSSKVCFGICDKITKKGEKRNHLPKNGVFGQMGIVYKFASKCLKTKERDVLLKQ